MKGLTNEELNNLDIMDSLSDQDYYNFNSVARDRRTNFYGYFSEDNKEEENLVTYVHKCSRRGNHLGIQQGQK